VQKILPSTKLLHVIGVVTEAAHKWQLVARTLGISDDVIDEIDRHCHGDPSKCCEGMLAKWLKSADHSWDSIIKACDKNGLHSIAIKIRLFFNGKEVTIFVSLICFLCVLGDEIFYETDVASWDYLVNQIKRVYLKWSITPKWCSQFNDAILSLTVVMQNCALTLEDAIYKLVVEEVSSKVLILVGVPGAGKTTMVRQLLHNWARSGSSSHYAFILYVNVTVDANKITDLQSLIKLHLERSSDPHMIKKMHDILLKQQGEGMLIILDEYDQTLFDEAQSSFINSLLTQELLPKCCLLLVCRPGCVPKDQCKIELIEIPALNKDQVNSYLLQTVGPLHTTAMNASQVWPLIYNPLLLNILCYLIKCGIDVTGISILTKLYEIFVLKVLSDHVRKDDNHSAIVRSLLKVLAKASYDGLCCKEETLNGLSDLDIFVESGLVERSNSKEVKHNFVHLTIQEYLAAYHVAHSQRDSESLLANIKCDFFLSAFLSGITGKVVSTLVQDSLAIASICYAEARYAWNTTAEKPLPFTEKVVLDIPTLIPYHLNCIKIFLKETRVSKVDISGYDYKRMELLNLIQLPMKKHITSLPKHAECIDDIMSCRYLTNLNAERVNFSLVTWTDFANMLKSNTSLLKVNVSHSNITDHKIVNIISESLTANRCLRTLLLRFCNLVKSHADCIIKSLLSNKTLYYLDLSNNLIKELNINIVRQIIQLGVIQVIG